MFFTLEKLVDILPSLCEIDLEKVKQALNVMLYKIRFRLLTLRKKKSERTILFSLNFLFLDNFL